MLEATASVYVGPDSSPVELSVELPDWSPARRHRRRRRRYIVRMAAMVTMELKKCPRRRFSLGLCWLLSWFTVGTMSAGDAERLHEGGDRDGAAAGALADRRFAPDLAERLHDAGGDRVVERRAEGVGARAPRKSGEAGGARLSRRRWDPGRGDANPARR